jgi:hypothetical protein
MIGLLKVTLPDQLLERVRRNFADAIAELQKLPAAFLRIKSTVVLADGETTMVAHGLGRAPMLVIVSPPRGAISSGRIEEVRSGVDSAKYIALKAIGYGGAVTVDVGAL